MQGIAVLDAGGQYCHLLARRVREVGVQSHVLPIDITADQLGAISGIIISGGPRSVTEPDSPRIHPSILSMGVPILGICYGHQLLAATMPGGVVEPSYSRERHKVAGYETTSLLAVPILHQGLLTGVIELLNRRGSPEWAPHEVELLERIACAAGSLVHFIGERR